MLINAQEPARSIGYILIGVLTAIILAAEPLASAVLDLLVAFGATLTGEQKDATITVIRIVASIAASAGAVKVASEAQRKRVTPWVEPEPPVAAPDLPPG